VVVLPFIGFLNYLQMVCVQLLASSSLSFLNPFLHLHHHHRHRRRLKLRDHQHRLHHLHLLRHHHPLPIFSISRLFIARRLVSYQLIQAFLFVLQEPKLISKVDYLLLSFTKFVK